MRVDGEPTGSIPEVCEVTVVGGPQADPSAPADLLFELPHGATRLADYEAVRRRLVGTGLPDRLEQFFFVNTDIGSPEYARAAAKRIVASADRPGLKVRLLRCLIPRTFIDCNRDAGLDRDGFREAAFTAALPSYVDHEQDVALLRGRYAAYQAVAERAYAEVCGTGGLALQLHTYAPRSIGISEIGADIVEALHRAYEPDVLENWPARPDVDLITETTDGESLAPAGLVRRLQAGYARIGIEATCNQTYRLHPATMGHRHSVRYPQRVTVVEISRGLLAEPFLPFEENEIVPGNAERLGAPIADACLQFLAERSIG